MGTLYTAKIYIYIHIHIYKYIVSKLNSSNIDGTFTRADSNLIESVRNSSDSSGKQIFREIFLFYHEIVCCVYSLESSLR